MSHLRTKGLYKRYIGESALNPAVVPKIPRTSSWRAKKKLNSTNQPTTPAVLNDTRESLSIVSDESITSNPRSVDCVDENGFNESAENNSSLELNQSFESFPNDYLVSVNNSNSSTNSTGSDYSNSSTNSTGSDYSDILNKTDDDFSESTDKLFPDSQITKIQSLLLITSYILRHKVSGEALKDLLKLLNAHHPNIVPPSYHTFVNQLNVSKYAPKVYVTCDNCETILEESCGECLGCSKQCNRDLQMKQGNFFIYMNLRATLENIFNIDEVKSNFEKHKSAVRNDGILSDVIDGQNYKKCKKVMKADDVTLIWNFDGVPLFISSEYSVHPLQATIAELPYCLRKKNVLLLGLWFGKGKPRVNSYLKPFVDECKELSCNGFLWEGLNGKQCVSRVFPIICTADAIARPSLRNAKQFNGLFGCDWCKHPGERIARGDGYARVYPLADNFPINRTHKNHIETLKTASDLNPVDGVKGPTILLCLEMFDIVSGFVPDYMHSCLLGVMRQFLTLWIDSSNHLQPWYIGNRTNEIDNLLLALRPPAEITRTPRSLTCRKYWKASEFRAFLLYYGPKILKDILPKAFFKHYIYLAYAINYLLRDEVDQANVKIAHQALCKFVRDIPTLYGLEHVSFNVHQLTHLSQAVLNWGPLWLTSAFVFEGNNKKLLDMFFGTTHVIEQIAKRFSLKNWVSFNSSQFKSAPNHIKLLFEDLNTCKKFSRRNSVIGPVSLIGSRMICKLKLDEKYAIEHLLKITLNDLNCTYYKRFIYNNVLFSTRRYTREVKRCNNYVQMNDNEFIELLNCLVLEIKNGNKYEFIVVLLGKKLPLKKSKSLLRANEIPNLKVLNNYYFVNNEACQQQQLVAYNVESIKSKSFFLQTSGDGSKYDIIVPIVNKNETD